MPASVIAERVGWTGSSSWFRENVAKLRPEQQRVDPADRLVWSPGDAAQCDLWFPPQRIPLEDGTRALLPVLVMVAAYSRFINALMIPTRQTPDLLLGMWSLVRSFGRVPRRLIWDNETGIGRRGRLAAGVGEFCGTLATRIHQLKALDPESKGVVERRNGFFETSFIPGRTFTSPGDLHDQFTECWDDCREGSFSLRGGDSQKSSAPSRAATSSPSSTTRRPSNASASPASSGNEAVALRPLRVWTRTVPSTVTSARQPSHFTS